MQFLVEAKAAGFAVDEKLLSRLTAHARAGAALGLQPLHRRRELRRAGLGPRGPRPGRPGQPRLRGGAARRKTQFLDLEGVAEVLQPSRLRGSRAHRGRAARATLCGRPRHRLFQGQEIYGGLQDGRPSRNGLVLPSETRTVAEVTRAFARRDPKNAKLPLLTQALVTLGRDDGWGSTNANASALLALTELLQPQAEGGPATTVAVKTRRQGADGHPGPGQPRS